MTEELVVDQRLGERAYRESHKRLVGAGAQLMDRRGHNSFASTTFAGNQNSGKHAGNLANNVANPVHGFAVSQQAIDPFAGNKLLRGGKLTRHRRAASGTIYGKPELLNIKRLLQKIHGTVLEKLQ